MACRANRAPRERTERGAAVSKAEAHKRPCPSERISLPESPPRQVGRFDMAVACAELSPEAAQRWASRAEILAGWLLALWRQERQGGGGE